MSPEQPNRIESTAEREEGTRASDGMGASGGNKRWMVAFSALEQAALARHLTGQSKSLGTELEAKPFETKRRGMPNEESQPATPAPKR
jgi:hypothetical protein